MSVFLNEHTLVGPNQTCHKWQLRLQQQKHKRQIQKRSDRLDGNVIEIGAWLPPPWWLLLLLDCCLVPTARCPNAWRRAIVAVVASQDLASTASRVPHARNRCQPTALPTSWWSACLPTRRGPRLVSRRQCW